MLYFAVIILLFVMFMLFSQLLPGFSSAPWVPTKKSDLKRIFCLMDLRPGDIFYDLGAGNGKVAFFAAQHCRARSIGLEMAVPMYLICRARQFFYPGLDISFKLKNFFKEDLSSADAVYLYGYPRSIKNKVLGKLERELKSGAKVVSYAFRIPGWKEVAKDKPGKKSRPVYLYLR